MTRISEGFVNKYLIPGVFLIITGLIGIAVGSNKQIEVVICGIVLMLIAIALFASTSGLDIDTETKRYRRYGKCGPLVLGDWKPMPNAVELRVQIHAENATIGGWGLMPIPSQTTKSLTYDLVSIDTLNEKVEIYNFSKYRNAKKSGQILAECLEVELKDMIAEKLGRRRSRRR
jgi:hypothetical protein